MTRAPRRRAPEPVAGAVAALAARLRPATPLGAVQAVWAEAVGPAIAREAEPVAERGGTVTVACSSAVWAQEIGLMAPALTAELNRTLAAEAGGGSPVRVERLRCSAAPGRRGGA